MKKPFHGKPDEFDIIVVGGGHAGVEAALAAARLDCRVMLITIDPSTIARMSCNPAIGGLAKGHLVAEIDALGGEMGKIIDTTGIQFRILNRSKGQAVWSPRAQADKIQYSSEAQRRLANQKNIEILNDLVIGIKTFQKSACGVTTRQHGTISATAVILTCGTFLNGLIHIGLDQMPGGRMGEERATGLTESLAELGIVSGRLKTGTPPRILKESIDFDRTLPQYGDEMPVPFSFQTENFNPPNVPCYLTSTNPATHRELTAGFERSPLYTGVIKGVGPRYCPSIEDKIVRFKERDTHQIFLEPEWLDADEYYVNGFSTSLPLDVQKRALMTIPGLERVEIIRPGYAIEYDYFPSYQIYSTLETKVISGLYLAGQINGTSGYEEAAALGLIAGINAASKLKGLPPFVLSRAEAYIGVLVDDLITKNPTEPYRMFTSSAEHRLLLRFETADRRLLKKGFELGLQSQASINKLSDKVRLIDSTISLLKDRHLSIEECNKHFSASVYRPHPGTSLYKVLCRPEISFQHIMPFLPEMLKLRLNRISGLSGQIETDIKYAGYIKRSMRMIESMRQHEEMCIPVGFDYSAIRALTNEARDKLTKINPSTIGQASRIPGVSPADITTLFVLLTHK